MRNTLKIYSHVNQRGIGLVEVMVALMLLAIAVLGFSAMQMTAVKATDESLMRTRALTVMRGGAEMMRANPDGIASFKSALQNTTSTVSVDGETIDIGSCMQSSTVKSCTINQLAARDALTLKNHASKNDMQINIETCPGTAGNQEKQCLIASWSTTKPIFNNTDTDACAKKDGTYKSGAQCFIMEAY